MGAIFNNPLIFTIAFLFLLFFPGWSLGKIFKISLEDWTGKILSYFILSLAFYFIFAFIGITLGLSLSLISFLIIIISIILFVLAIILNFKTISLTGIDWKNRFRLENIYYLLPIALGVFLIWLVNYKGPSLDGDPYFHLAIIRKALDGDSLSPRALAFSKTQMINPAYIYPAWHVFLAFLAKIFSLNIFQVWSNILIGLTIVSIFSWYYLSKVIFEKKSWAVLALSLFLIFTLYGGPGYLFTRLGVPDTLAGLILLPLGLAFSLKYIFEPSITPETNRKLLIVNFLVAFILLVLHGPHYFYLLVSVAFFGILYSLSHFRDSDYKVTVSKILKVFLVELSILILASVVIELRTHSISAALSEFGKSATGGVNLTTSFTKFPLVYKYGFLLLPLTLIFFKSKRLLIIVATMLLTPLIYFTPLSIFFSKVLSGVFTDRLMANTAFYFYVFALVLGTILLIKDRFASRFLKNKYFSAILTVFFGAILIFIEEKWQIVSDIIYKIFYAKPTNSFINNHAWAIFIIIAMIVLLIIILLKIRKTKIETSDFKNPVFAFLQMLIIGYILITPTIVNLRYQLSQPKNLTGEAYFQNLIHNDQKALDFVKNQVPDGSVILAGSTAAKGLPTLENQYMAYNVGSSYDDTFKWVFDKKNPELGKLETVTNPKWAIDYIYLDDPVNQGSHFNSHPEVYQKIYDGQAEIYKLIK